MHGLTAFPGSRPACLLEYDHGALRSESQSGQEPLMLEAAFYDYAHSPHADARADSLSRIKTSLLAGVRSRGFEIGIAIGAGAANARGCLLRLRALSPRRCTG